MSETATIATAVPVKCERENSLLIIIRNKCRTAFMKESLGQKYSRNNYRQIYDISHTENDRDHEARHRRIFNTKKCILFGCRRLKTRTSNL